MFDLFTLQWACAALLLCSAGLGAGLAWQAARRRAEHAQWEQAANLLEQQRDVNLSQQLELGELNAQVRAEQQQAQHWQQQCAAARGEVQQLREHTRQAQVEAAEAQRQASVAEASQVQLQAREVELKTAHGQLQQLQNDLQGRFTELSREHATLTSSLVHKELHFAEQQQLLKESREQLKLEFEQLAGQIFEAKGRAFSQHSQQSLDALLKPFREQIDGFRAKVEDIHHKDVQQQAALTQELLHLKELNRQITQEAHDLSTALRGQKKAQGNWGELILENVLDRSGLVLGRDYKREVSITGENGRQRPDAIVYLPQGKHLIIDAKVSLNAYVRYINSEDEAERRVALAEHVSAFGARIRELAERNYFDLPGLNAPEMVFMFVPIESAFVEALKADESLFHKAIEQNVLVATPTTLLTSLNIVRQLWRFEDQSKHTAELADRAAKVYDKLRTFLGSMDAVGSSLERAQEAYRRACDQLVNGRGNLVKQVNDFRQLGVAVKGELSGDWVDRAELELGRAGVETSLQQHQPGLTP